jgi:hypothetical protein
LMLLKPSFAPSTASSSCPTDETTTDGHSSTQKA